MLLRPYRMTVVLQAAGGLLIGAVLKYASNLAKGFATSVSMITSSVISIWLFDFAPSGYFVAGSGIVIMSVVMYSRPDPQLQTIETKAQPLIPHEQK